MHPVVSDSLQPYEPIACQAPVSMGFSRQEYWSGLPCLPPVDLPDPGITRASLQSPALTGVFFTTSSTWEAPVNSCGDTQTCIFLLNFRHVFLFSCLLEISRAVAHKLNRLQTGRVTFPPLSASNPAFFGSAGPQLSPSAHPGACSSSSQ